METIDALLVMGVSVLAPRGLLLPRSTWLATSNWASVHDRSQLALSRFLSSDREHLERVEFPIADRCECWFVPSSKCRRRSRYKYRSTGNVSTALSRISG